MCAAIANACFSRASAPCTSATTSAGSRRCSATYSSNSVTTRRAIARSSAPPAGSSSANGVTMARSTLSVGAYRVTFARATPSTSTFVVPFGSRATCSTRPATPTRKRSAAAGSCVSAVRWATRKIHRSPGERGLDGRERRRPPHEQRDHHVREDHDVPERQHRESVLELELLFVAGEGDRHALNIPPRRWSAARSVVKPTSGTHYS